MDSVQYMDEFPLISSSNVARCNDFAEAPGPSEALLQHNGLLASLLPAASPNSEHSNICPSALLLSTQVATECGSHLSEKDCCFILKRSVQADKALDCLCVLAGSDALSQVQITIRDLVDVYASCMRFRPSGLHLPSRECAEGNFHIAYFLLV
jgi:hypothetical protein